MRSYRVMVITMGFESTNLSSILSRTLFVAHSYSWSRLHRGHVLLILSHLSMQIGWYTCLHLSYFITSSSCSSQKHIAQFYSSPLLLLMQLLKGILRMSYLPIPSTFSSYANDIKISSKVSATRARAIYKYCRAGALLSYIILLQKLSAQDPLAYRCVPRKLSPLMRFSNAVPIYF